MVCLLFLLSLFFPFYVNQSLENLILNKLYPVGSIYLETTNTNPASKLGGTWVTYGSSDTYLRLGGKGSGGSNTVTLAANQIPTLSGSATSSTATWRGLCKYGESNGTNVTTSHTLLSDPYGGSGLQFWEATYKYSQSHAVTIPNSNQASVSVTPKYVQVYAWKRTA